MEFALSSSAARRYAPRYIIQCLNASGTGLHQIEAQPDSMPHAVTSSSLGSDKVYIIVGAVMGAVLFLFILIVVLLWFLYRRSRYEGALSYILTFPLADHIHQRAT